MAEKRINPLLIGGVAIAVVTLTLTLCSQRNAHYEPVDQIPEYDPTAKRRDGDTPTDTIKALQAYAREAVKKADDLHSATEQKMEQVLKNQHKVETLERQNQAARETLADTKSTIQTLEQNLTALQQQIVELQGNRLPDDTPLNADGLPVGFGFDDGQLPVPVNPDQGAWYNPIDWRDPESEEGGGNRFTGLLPRSPGTNAPQQKTTPESATPEKEVIDPIYTIPKDATLTDGLALTALIGRIPVEGQTPDPYPVKIYIGRENLLANGHELPEVEGMIFSGLGFGDWNLSCVSARLMSATFIFEDGAIANHSSDGEPLGYISDPSGVPCVEGRFVTNAPAFISQRIGLSALGAAGAAYADAQQESQTSAFTGSTTRTVVGDINKLAAGEAVQSATDEVSRWLLARQKQSFDAVVVNPGAAVAVHLDRSLPLDDHSLARRIRYGKEADHLQPALD